MNSKVLLTLIAAMAIGSSVVAYTGTITLVNQSDTTISAQGHIFNTADTNVAHFQPSSISPLQSGTIQNQGFDWIKIMAFRGNKVVTLWADKTLKDGDFTITATGSNGSNSYSVK